MVFHKLSFAAIVLCLNNHKIFNLNYKQFNYGNEYWNAKRCGKTECYYLK